MGRQGCRLKRRERRLKRRERRENGLEGAVEKKNARLANETPHLGVIDVLVDHDTLEHAAVFDFTTGDFLDFGVAFHVDIRSAVLREGELHRPRAFALSVARSLVNHL
jgi:hypothetical protein